MRFNPLARDLHSRTNQVWKRYPGKRLWLVATVTAMIAGSTLASATEEAHPRRAEADIQVASILEIKSDAAYGAYLAGDCVACHRPSGGSGIPPIAGLPVRHIVNALVEYKLEIRKNEVMVIRTSRLGDEEIAALAAHFSAQE